MKKSSPVKIWSIFVAFLENMHFIWYCSFWSKIWHAFLWFLRFSRFSTQFLFYFFRYSNRRTISSSDRTLINAFRTISGMCDRINLPRTITDRANALFKKVHDGKNLRGRSNDAISSGRISIKLKKMSSNHTISYEKKYK